VRSVVRVAEAEVLKRAVAAERRRDVARCEVDDIRLAAVGADDPPRDPGPMLAADLSNISEGQRR
jgi:hypothetical protein